MSDRPFVSADRKPLSAKRRRRRLFALTALAAALFLWPAILQIERLAPRVESLKVLGQGEPGAGHGGRGRAAPHPGHHPSGLTAPNFGALREGSPNLLEAPPITTLAEARAQDFVPPADVGQTPPSQGGPPFGPPSPRPFEPDLFVGGPGGGPPVIGPGGLNPPITNPPVTNPPVIDPPVVDPGTPQPPVVTPPDGNPPVVPPPVGPTPVTDPNPPVTGPGGTFTPPDDPGGTGPGPIDPRTGDPPVSPAPEPAVWLELVLGAGLAGAALRHARRQPVAIALRAVSRRSTTT